MIPTYTDILRFEMFRTLDFLAGMCAPRYLAKAWKKAVTLGIENELRPLLSTKELEAIAQAEKHPTANMNWIYVSNITALEYARAVQQARVNTVIKPSPFLLLPAPRQPVALLPAPRIAGLLVSGPVCKRVARIKLVTDYGTRTMAHET